MTEWADAALADEYLANKPGTTAWLALGTGDTQPYLTTAYRNIYYDPDYSIPSSPSASQLTLLQYAQIELAYYIYSNPDAEKRQNLISAGVKSLRIGQFSESYAALVGGRDAEGQTKYPTIVADYLRSFLKSTSLTTNLTRAQEDII